MIEEGALAAQTVIIRWICLYQGQEILDVYQERADLAKIKARPPKLNLSLPSPSSGHPLSLRLALYHNKARTI